MTRNINQTAVLSVSSQKSCAWPFGDTPSSQGISGGMETTGKLCKNEITEKAPFIVDESLDVPPEQTHLHPARCADTSEVGEGRGDFL